MDRERKALRRRTLRVLTYNVHGCVGTDRRLDPTRIAEVIAACDADIVALQELDVGRRRSGWMDQAVAIAQHLAMETHFHPALHLEEEKYGDAILSRFPSRLIRADALPSVGEPRGALAVEIDVEGRRLVVVNTHLGLRGRERVRQAETLLGSAWLRHPEIRDRPAILLGDFNAIPRSQAYRMLTQNLTDAATADGRRGQPTFPSRLPLLRIDHVFLGGGLAASGTRVVNSRLARVASDHLPLLAHVLMPARERARSEGVQPQSRRERHGDDTKEDEAMTMTREEVVSVLGPADDPMVAEIVATGASLEELREAWAWLNGDEALMGEGRPLPDTRVASLIALLEPEEDEA